jgi:hypothetical protein
MGIEAVTFESPGITSILRRMYVILNLNPHVDLTLVVARRCLARK